MRTPRRTTINLRVRTHRYKRLTSYVLLFFPLVCLMKRKMDLTTYDKFESLEDFRNGICSTAKYWAGEDLFY